MKSDYRDLFPELEYLGSATRYVEDITGIIDQAPLFDDLKLPEVEALCGFMECFGAPRNVSLMEEGSQGDFLLIVLTGAVKVVKRAGDGSPKTIATVGPGASLGEMSMIDGAPRFASCVTVEPTDFAVLSRHDLSQVVASMPRLGNKFLLLLLQVMATRLRDASNAMLPHMAGSWV
jgi:CRP-like cAMP-binding protein